MQLSTAARESPKLIEKMEGGTRTQAADRVVLLAVLLMGFSSTTVQVLLIREMLIVFSGNELTIGIMLTNWLILGAIGSWISSRFIGRRIKAWQIYALLQIIVSVLALVALYAARTARTLGGLSVGEIAGPFSTFSWSLLILAPVAIIGGSSFTFACKMHGAFTGSGAKSSGRVFAFEAAGSAVGGVAVTAAFIPHLNSVQALLFVAALNLSSVLVLIVKSNGRPPAVRELTPPRILNLSRKARLTLLAAIFLALTVLLLISPLADQLHGQSIKAQWAGHNLRFYGNSVYSNLAVTESEGEFTFFVDGLPFLTAPVPDLVSVEELAHFAMLSHPSPRTVLIIGGGAGGLLHEVLKHKVEKAEYVELDPLIIEALEEFPTRLTEAELHDPRVLVRYGDGRLLLSESSTKYDVIIVNLPSPSTILLNRFYTREFFTLTKQTMTGNGVLAIPVQGSTTYIGEELAHLNACVYRTLLSVFPYVRPVPGHFNIFLASASHEVSSISPEGFAERFVSRVIDTSMLSVDYIKYKLDQERLDWFLRSLDPVNDAKTNEDFLPSGLFYGLWVSHAKLSHSLAKAFRIAKDLDPFVLLVLAGAFLCMFFQVVRRATGVRSASTTTVIISTGFFGMASSVILMVALQSLYGLVYHLIGLLTAAFMIGLTVGSMASGRATDNMLRTAHSLWKIELMIVCYSLLVPVVLLFLRANAGDSRLLMPVQLGIFALCLLAGAMVGMEFSLANRVYPESASGVGKVAGILYACDLSGACIGAVFVSVLLLPIAGVINTCLFIAGLKVTSLGLILAYGFRIR